MDDVALRYLLLGLRLGRHLPRFVRSYTGPAQLAEAVGGEPPTPPAELHDEAMQVAGLAADLPSGTAPQRWRVAWLVAQSGAMAALARWAGGEEIGYLDLLEELYDIEVQLEPDATFEAARRMLDAALPGSGPLRDRLAAHDARARIRPEQAIGTASELAARLRMRTRAHLWLPERESLRLEAARDAGWAVDARYLGSGNSVVRVNLDHPLTLATLVEIAAHEGYPGHHAEAAAKDELLASAGHDELRLITTLSPQALVSEGMAGFAREVVMSDQELAAELARLTPTIDEGPKIGAEMVVQRARRLLIPALGNAAVAVHRDGEPLSRVRDYLAEAAVVPDQQLDQTVAFVADALLSAEAFAGIEGRRLISDWLETRGQTHGFGRLLAEQMTPRTLRQELGSA
jgi:hypothetical protein